MSTLSIGIALALPLLSCPAPSTAESSPAKAAPEFDQTHAAWTAVLTKRVQGDRFDYAGLRAERKPLDVYIAQLEGVSAEQFGTWEREQRYAFWINAYNAYTIKLLLDHEPVDSIKDLGTLLTPVWKQRFIPLGKLWPGTEKSQLTLDEIEHSILRPEFKDARVHVAVNCASESCPPLLAAAFRADKLDEQLDAQARVFVADGARNQLDPSTGTCKVSKLFDWFASDFERDAGSVTGWLAKYASPELAAWLTEETPRVRYLDYSWKLNAAR